MVDRISCIHDKMTVMAVDAYNRILSIVSASYNAKGAKGTI